MPESYRPFIQNEITILAPTL